MTQPRQVKIPAAQLILSCDGRIHDFTRAPRIPRAGDGFDPPGFAGLQEAQRALEHQSQQKKRPMKEIAQAIILRAQIPQSVV